MTLITTISSPVSIPSVPAAFRVLVQSVEDGIIADTTLDWGTLPKKVYFIHDTPKKVAITLQEYTNSPDFKNKKYPLVIMFEDIDGNLRQGLNGLTYLFKCRIVICTLTNPNLRADERDLRNFDPILVPIAQEFLRQLRKSQAFSMPTVDDLNPPFSKRYSWGAVEVDKNILNDFIDAVEFRSITLNLKTIC